MSDYNKTSYELAKYVMAGLPVPEELSKKLIDELCDEYIQTQKRAETQHHNKTVARD